MNYRLLLPLILLFSTLSIHAEERWFEVELLLFQRNVDINDVKEDFSIKDSIVNTDKSIPLLKMQKDTLCDINEKMQNNGQENCVQKKLSRLPVLVNNSIFDSENNGFKLLDNDQLQLTPQRKKLEQHAAFTPLLHLAWRMPVKSKVRSIPIHLIAGENFTNTPPHVAQNKQISSSEQMLTNEPLPPDALFGNKITATDNNNMLQTQNVKQADKWTIDGNLKIYLQHYLFIDSQLIVRQKTTQNINTHNSNIEVINEVNDVQFINDLNNTSTAQQKTVIKEALFDQNRRLRSEEIHYFDNPLMGMIIQIRKIPEDELNRMLEKTI